MLALSVASSSSRVFQKKLKSSHVIPEYQSLTYEGVFGEFYFHTGYDDSSDFSIHYQTMKSIDQISMKEEYYLGIGLNSRLDGEGVQKFPRKRISIVIALDVSGSMLDLISSSNRQTKFEVAVEAIRILINRLKDDDMIALIIYNSTSKILIPFTPRSALSDSYLMNKISEIEVGGRTSLEEGVFCASSLFEELYQSKGNYNDEYLRRIIYITDLVPNLSKYDGATLFNLTEFNAEDKHIYTTFIGVGIEFHFSLLDRISKIRGCNHVTITSINYFREQMSKEFEYLITPAAFNSIIKFQSSSFLIDFVFGVPSIPPKQMTCNDNDDNNNNNNESNDKMISIFEIKTLFPSLKEKKYLTKGGIILIRLKPISELVPGEAFEPIHLQIDYEDRDGKFRSNKYTIDNPFSDLIADLITENDFLPIRAPNDDDDDEKKVKQKFESKVRGVRSIFGKYRPSPPSSDHIQQNNQQSNNLVDISDTNEHSNTNDNNNYDNDLKYNILSKSSVIKAILLCRYVTLTRCFLFDHHHHHHCKDKNEHKNEERNEYLIERNREIDLSFICNQVYDKNNDDYHSRDLKQPQLDFPNEEADQKEDENKKVKNHYLPFIRELSNEIILKSDEFKDSELRVVKKYLSSLSSCNTQLPHINNSVINDVMNSTDRKEIELFLLSRTSSYHSIQSPSSSSTSTSSPSPLLSSLSAFTSILSSFSGGERNEMKQNNNDNNKPNHYIDIIFSFDVTGSMGSSIVKAKEEIIKITKYLFSVISGDQLRVGIIAHGDYTDSLSSRFQYLELTNNQHDILSFVNSVVVANGHDFPENYEYVFNFLHENVNWRFDCQSSSSSSSPVNDQKLSYDSLNSKYSKIGVIIGDATPHHSSECFNQMKQNDWKNARAINWKIELEKCYQNDIKLYAIRAHCSNNNNNVEFFFQSIAARTCGLYLPLSNFQLLHDLFVLICLKEFDQAEFDRFEASLAKQKKISNDRLILFDLLC